MTYHVTIGPHSAKLMVERDSFTYTRETGADAQQESLAKQFSKQFSIEQVDASTYSVLIEGRSYRAQLSAKGEIIVNGRTFAVEVNDPRKLRGRGSADSGSGRKTITAPMPGRVISILVEKGQQIEAGQGLIVVEAMKMQNEMKSPRAGKVLEIRTTTGAAVSAGDALLVIE
jgi:biotin carboxyl carrier protein